MLALRSQSLNLGVASEYCSVEQWGSPLNWRVAARSETKSSTVSRTARIAYAQRARSHLPGPPRRVPAIAAIQGILHTEYSPPLAQPTTPSPQQLDALASHHRSSKRASPFDRPVFVAHALPRVALYACETRAGLAHSLSHMQLTLRASSYNVGCDRGDGAENMCGQPASQLSRSARTRRPGAPPTRPATQA